MTRECEAKQMPDMSQLLRWPVSRAVTTSCLQEAELVKHLFCMINVLFYAVLVCQWLCSFDATSVQTFCAGQLVPFFC